MFEHSFTNGASSTPTRKFYTTSPTEATLAAELKDLPSLRDGILVSAPRAPIFDRDTDKAACTSHGIGHAELSGHVEFVHEFAMRCGIESPVLETLDSCAFWSVFRYCRIIVCWCSFDIATLLLFGCISEE